MSVPAAAPRRVDVALAEHAYPITIGAGALADASGWLPLVRGRHVLLVSDANVAPLYAATVQRALHAHASALHVLPSGEPHKTLAQAELVFAALAALGASRDATILALGGGVVGDLAGFAAACWMRGIDCVQMPTTLLAMVDSAVGGKTAVNLVQGKNLVGAFHQPRGVVIDTDTLSTLPPRELASGLAEVLKYGAIADPAFFAWVAANGAALRARDAGALAHAIETSCRHKAAIVARDEREHGERALLNFGHTFGHALETATGYEGLLHGEAVAIGMLLAARLSTRLGLAPERDADTLAAALRALGLPLAPPAGLDAAELLAHMRLDKKAASGRLRLVLWDRIGAARLVDGVADDAILATLREAGAA